jgi:hypothetical protein
MIESTRVRKHAIVRATGSAATRSHEAAICPSLLAACCQSMSVVRRVLLFHPVFVSHLPDSFSSASRSQRRTLSQESLPSNRPPAIRLESILDPIRHFIRFDDRASGSHLLSGTLFQSFSRAVIPGQNGNRILDYSKFQPTCLMGTRVEIH